MKSRIAPVAITILIIGIFVGLFWLLAVFGGLISIIERGTNVDDLIGFFFCGSMLLMNVIAVVGAIKMLNLKSHKFCLISVILFMIAGLPCCVIPTLIGVWGLVVLLDADAKYFFN